MINNSSNNRDTSFRPISSDELISILGLTIKRDKENKLITFLGMLSAYTESSQLNISYNAPSSTGKSYIPTEIARLFPAKDVIQLGYCSPTAFFHGVGQYVKERNGYIVDLERKILIFLDQPHTQLLEHLRPLLSHDKKEIAVRITDKSQKAGLKTKNIFLRGYPSVIFCTAGLRIDEQEATRFLLLSPQSDQEKIREAIQEKIKKEADSRAYEEWLLSNPGRERLQERIIAIKKANITEINIGSPEKIEAMFLKKGKGLRPRDMRDIDRILSLIKVFALVNMWFREEGDSTLIANEEDIDGAFKVWEEVSESQEYNLPPYVYDFYQDVILKAYEEVGRGLFKEDIMRKHYQVYGRVLQDWSLRQQIIPMLESAGLIRQEPDKEDKRKILIYPTMPPSISQAVNNSEWDGRVCIPDSENIVSEVVG
jgi:hypothetical protein